MKKEIPDFCNDCYGDLLKEYRDDAYILYKYLHDGDTTIGTLRDFLMYEWLKDHFFRCADIEDIEDILKERGYYIIQENK